MLAEADTIQKAKELKSLALTAAEWAKRKNMGAEAIEYCRSYACLLALDEDERANAAPPLPESPVSRPGDLWLGGPHRVLCGDATSAEAVARLLGERKPRLMVTDPPYGIELDSEWRDRAGLNGCGPDPRYMKKRTKGHTQTSISGDTRAEWSDAFALVPSLEVAYVWQTQ